MDDTINNCNDYEHKDSNNCARCVNCAGVDDLGEIICCMEIEYWE